MWPVDQMDQAMLGMPSREYYLTETDSEYKAAYLRYMINVAKLFGADEAAAVRDMEDVLHFEELLANVGLFFHRSNYSIQKETEVVLLHHVVSVAHVSPAPAISSYFDRHMAR